MCYSSCHFMCHIMILCARLVDIEVKQNKNKNDHEPRLLSKPKSHVQSHSETQSNTSLCTPRIELDWKQKDSSSRTDDFRVYDLCFSFLLYFPSVLKVTFGY